MKTPFAPAIASQKSAPAAIRICAGPGKLFILDKTMAAVTDMTIEELISNFEFLDNWEDRYAYLIDLGRKLPPMDEADKTEDNRVKGCQATVWLKEKIEDGTNPVIHFAADSNSTIVKGLVSILVIIYSGKTPKEILATDAKPVFATLNLEQNLSPTRKIGLHAMMKQIKLIAAQAETRD